MASLQLDDKTVCQGMPGAFKIQGMLYRRLGPMIPQQGHQESFLQTYFLDPAEQPSARAGQVQQFAQRQLSDREQRWDLELFTTLQEILTECNNTYINSFKSVKEYVESENINPTEVSIQIHATD